MAARTMRRRIAAANASHIRKLEIVLRREFGRFLGSIDPKKTDIHAHAGALREHQAKLAAILAAHKRATALTFAFLAVEMSAAPIVADEQKAEPPKPVGQERSPRADRVARVLTELAKTVTTGAGVAVLAQALAQNRSLVGQVELAILAAPRATPATIAASLMRQPRVAAMVLVAQAQATGVSADLAAIADALDAEGTPASRPSRVEAETTSAPSAPQTPSGNGTSPPKPPPPPSPPGGGGRGEGPRPRRSRFGEMVERIVREEAPVRARRIARTSGRQIADVLGRAAAEGWGEQRTAQELQKALGPQVALYRARAIARTELGGAQNGATFQIGLDREAAGEELDKGWASIDDDRRRPSHRDADGQRVALREKFHVGDAMMMYPHDPTAPLKEIISCRCSLMLFPRLRYEPGAG